jgi:hypothetical protein
VSTPEHALSVRGSAPSAVLVPIVPGEESPNGDSPVTL